MSAARRYVEALLDLLEAHSLRQGEIDWPHFRAELLAEIAGCRTAADTHPAIRSAVRRLGDRHSRFLPPSEIAAGTERLPPPPRGERLGPVAYLAVPWFAANRHVSAAEHAAKLQHLTAGLDAPGTAGWIVDLRGNGGGNMWPMLAGLGPLLGEGVLGFFTAPGAVDLPWIHAGGAMSLGEDVLLRLTADSYRLRSPDPPVAVLTGPWTSSSGEAVCIAFRGRPRTRSFGAPTSGHSTGNAVYSLEDGAVLYLTTVVMADRTGRSYGETVDPDEAALDTGEASTGNDPVVARAAQWICEASVMNLDVSR